MGKVQYFIYQNHKCLYFYNHVAIYYKINGDNDDEPYDYPSKILTLKWKFNFYSFA